MINVPFPCMHWPGAAGAARQKNMSCDGGDGLPAYAVCSDCGTLCRACDAAIHSLPKMRDHIRRTLPSPAFSSSKNPLVFDMPTSSASVDAGRLNRRIPSVPVSADAAMPADPPPPYTPPTEAELLGAIPRRPRRKTKCEEFQHHLRLYCTLL